MARPQLENGFTPVANEILEALSRINLSPYESRVLHYIIRKTYGWHKKEDLIPVSQIAFATGIAKGHVSRALKKLTNKQIIFRINSLTGFQKDYGQWLKKLPKQVTVTQTGNTQLEKLPKQVTCEDSKELPVQDKELPVQDKELPKQVTKRYPNRWTQKKERNYSKETIQKKLDVEGFNRFWSAYPIKRNKGKAEIAFKKAMVGEQLLAVMLSAIEQAKKSTQWLKENGQYIPYPATWLNAKGWEDEIKETTQQVASSPQKYYRGQRQQLPTEEEIEKSLE